VNDWNPLISIIVPIYQVEQYLKRCIESIVRQTYQRIEIILVDDGSKDSSLNICESFARDDNRIKIIQKSNGGLVTARKAGAESASGDYVSFVDGDDWIDADYIEKMVRSLANQRGDMVLAGFSRCIYGETEKKVTNGICSGIYDRDSIHKDIVPTLLNDCKNPTGAIIPAVWNKMFRREILMECLIKVDNGITLGEDIICSYLSLINSNMVIIDNEITGYHYRINETSMTGQNDSNFLLHVESLFKCIDKVFLAGNITLQQVNRYKSYILLIDGIGNIEKKCKNRFSVVYGLMQYNMSLINNIYLYEVICSCKADVCKYHWMQSSLDALSKKRYMRAVLAETLTRRCDY
jgi:glycosyltransferase involved in cell wall biosynthesis